MMGSYSNRMAVSHKPDNQGGNMFKMVFLRSLNFKRYYKSPLPLLHNMGCLPSPLLPAPPRSPDAFGPQFPTLSLAHKQLLCRTNASSEW